MEEFTCTKCGSDCGIDGEYPKYFAWCDECGDYDKGFNCEEHAADVMSARIDEGQQ